MNLFIERPPGYPEKHCKSQELGVAFLWIISSASSAFLFLRRAHAIFHQRRFCRYFYSCLYVVNVGISSVVPFGNKAVPLGQTGWCANSKVAPYVSAAIFSRLLFDSCIFLGISYEVATAQRLSGVGVTWRTIVTGKSSSRLIRSLLRGGQQYYLYALNIHILIPYIFLIPEKLFRISVCSNLVISLLVIIPGVPAIYQGMINVPDIALSSSMACRVFRNLKFSASHAEAMSIEFPTLEAPDSGTATGNIDGDNNLNA